MDAVTDKLNNSNKTAIGPNSKISAVKEPKTEHLAISNHKELQSQADLNEALGKKRDALQILSRYGLPKNEKTPSKTENKIFTAENGNEIIAELETEDSKKYSKRSMLSGITNIGRKVPNNIVLKMLKEGEINLISSNHKPMDPKFLATLVNEGVATLVAQHHTDQNGKFSQIPNAWIPLIDVEKFIEFKEKKPFKGMPRKQVEMMTKQLENLKSQDGFKNVKLIDTIIVDKDTKSEYSEGSQKRKDLLRCVADCLTRDNDYEVFIADNILDNSTEAEANNTNYHVLDTNFPVKNSEGKLENIDDESTLARNTSRDREPIPDELAGLYTAHNIEQFDGKDTIKPSPENMEIMRDSFKHNAQEFKKFNKTRQPKKIAEKTENEEVGATAA